MAIHPDLKSLIRESVPEYLHVVEYCVNFKKDSVWGNQQVGGCLGCPAAVMLFSIVDTIGSFYRGRTDLRIEISGTLVQIRRDGHQHFYILNSEYYGQSLDEPTIKKLYENFRNLLVHNASLAPSSILLHDPKQAALFPKVDGGLVVNLPAFLAKSREAAKQFLDRLDRIAPCSQQATNIARKR